MVEEAPRVICEGFLTRSLGSGVVSVLVEELPSVASDGFQTIVLSITEDGSDVTEEFPASSVSRWREASSPVS